MNSASRTRDRKRRPATFEALLKRAMLNVHGPVCTYRSIPIEAKHASVDHPIPRSVLTGDPARRAAVMAKFEFDPGAVDPLKDFRNLVLTDLQYNREKWDNVDGEWEEVVRKGLRVAADNARAVEDEFLYLKFQDQVELLWARLPEAVKLKANAARLHDTLTREAGPGKSEESRLNSHLVVRRPLVTVSAQLPSVEQHQGTACVTFNPLRLRDCAITFGHEQIVEMLLPGFGSELSHDRRRFVVYVPPGRDDVTVQLGNNRFPSMSPPLSSPGDSTNQSQGQFS